jgi:hypothetical protein
LQVVVAEFHVNVRPGRFVHVLWLAGIVPIEYVQVVPVVQDQAPEDEPVNPEGKVTVTVELGEEDRPVLM